MNFKQQLGRVLASALVASTVLSSAAFAGFDSGFTYSYPIAEGTTYSRSEGKNGAGLQKANIITYSPNSTVTPIVSYTGDKLYGSSATILEAASYVASQGMRVAGGVNADFFVMGTGVPLGLVIDKGTLVSSDAWQYAVGFGADGSTVMGQPTMSMKVTGATGAATVSYFNKTRTTAGLYLLDSNYDSSSHFSANGKNIIFERMDDAPVKVNGTVKMKVVNKGTGNSSITITENQMVLTQSDGAAGTWVDFPIGEEVTLEVYASDSRWANVDYAVGGKLLVQDGSASTSGIDAGGSKTARTAVGTKSDGSLVIYEIDGLQSSHSVGLTANELANEMLSLGCTSAICLDGGGSSMMAMSQPGENDVKLVSSPSGGSQRACANYIFLINKASSDGVTKHAVLTPTYRYILPGCATPFTVTGADSAYQAAPAPTGLDFTVNDNLGTVDGTTFTAADTAGTATITASSADGVDGYMMVCVTKGINDIALQSGGEAISAIALEAEKSIELDAVGYHLGQRMGTKDEAFTWTVSGGVGTVDATGFFKASDVSGSGTLTCSYGGVSKSIPVTVGMGNPQNANLVADFEGSAAFTLTNLEGRYLKDSTSVARGNQSYLIHGDVERGTLNLPQTSVLGMQYVSLYARTYGTCNLSAVFATESGAEITAPFTAAPSDAYALVHCSIPSDAKSLVGIQANATGGRIEAAVDHIVVIAHHAIANTSGPTITLSKTDLTVDAGAGATLSGTALMEGGAYPVREQNILVSVDGTPLSAAVSRSGATFSFTTGALAQGTHVVTVTAIDDAGNRAGASATVTAGSASSVFADTNGNWAAGYAALLNAQGIMQGETSGGKTYFRPTRNLTRMEFAVIMARSLGLDTSYSGNLDFADDGSIPAWARGAIKAVSDAGVMNGSQSGGKLYFNPKKEITRAEVMTVIGRSLPRGYQSAALSFKDAGSIPSWATEEVKICVQAGVIGGYADGTIKPLNSITRAEIAKILCVM